jgi:Zn-dependent oligopeptidase
MMMLLQVIVRVLIVFENSGSRDGDDMLKDFLGREPIMEPFLKSIGLDTA